jgi:alpha-L-fucosidase
LGANTVTYFSIGDTGVQQRVIEKFQFEQVCIWTIRQRKRDRIYLMAKYSSTSPYFSTPQNSINLEPLVIRPFAIEEDDQLYTIERTYAYRPDLLSFDLYGTPRLWWVFAQRNPDQIEDPIYDFKPGVVIQLPKQATVTRDLGI